MSAPKTIWAFHDGPMVGLFIGKKEVGSNIAEYTLTDPATITLDRAKYEALVKAVQSLGLRALVAGWNGEGRDTPYDPHPSRLGVTIKTTAGVVYEIDTALKAVQS